MAQFIKLAELHDDDDARLLLELDDDDLLLELDDRQLELEQELDLLLDEQDELRLELELQDDDDDAMASSVAKYDRCTASLSSGLGKYPTRLTAIMKALLYRRSCRYQTACRLPGRLCHLLYTSFLVSL